jgi:aldehyde dehydrogenase (NAD+)
MSTRRSPRQNAFESFSRTSVDERIALIERVLEAYKARAADMAEAISLEMGAPLSLAKTAQVGSGIGHLLSAARALKEFSSRSRSATASSSTRRSAWSR